MVVPTFQLRGFFDVRTVCDSSLGRWARSADRELAHHPGVFVFEGAPVEHEGDFVDRGVHEEIATRNCSSADSVETVAGAGRTRSKHILGWKSLVSADIHRCRKKLMQSVPC